MVAFLLHILAAVNLSFFSLAGSELHWRNIWLAGDPSSWPVLFTGFLTWFVIFTTILFVSVLLQEVVFNAIGLATDLITVPIRFFFNNLICSRILTRDTIQYYHLAQKGNESDDEVNDGDGHPSENSFWNQTGGSIPSRPRRKLPNYIFPGLLISVQTALYLLRPPESSLTFLSWTPALLPLIDFVHSSPTVAKSIPYFGKSISWAWDNRTALNEPAQWDWLPNLGHSLPGFEDWHGHDGSHYCAASDPLKISNLGNDVLPDLRHHLPGSSIRHVVLIKLESTRQDVFPLKKDGQIWQKLAATWQNGSWPEVVQQRLASLTPSANFLTGDYNEGYDHGHSRHRGGINVRDAHTTSTYTLKSITGTLCGVTPLVADFNVEHEQHIYQPCLPQILSMFNLLKRDNRSTSAGIRYTNHRWRSSFMMSVTNSYDKQDLLMRRLGYKDEDLVTKEYLQSDDAKFGKCTLPEINYYGLQESAVKDYIRDAFRTAEKQNERVFLTHLTSTTHHPFNIPNEEAYVPLVPGDQLEDLSHYLNSVGYVDQWLGRILDILDEQGVSNETLVVLVGDHGLSLPETGAVTPYYQPNVGNFHVPLVFSHPNLPLVNIDSPVNSISILPTILDLLIETGSLSFPQEKAARDLMHNYEGQSLLRPLHAASEQTGQVDWQFTVMNTGRAQVAVRSASSPQWRVVVPVVDDIEWRFTDIKEDPLEKNAVLSFDLEIFLRQVKIKHGISAARWVEEAAFMTRWWVNENAKRWRYLQ